MLVFVEEQVRLPGALMRCIRTEVLCSGLRNGHVHRCHQDCSQGRRASDVVAADVVMSQACS